MQPPHSARSFGAAPCRAADTLCSELWNVQIIPIAVAECGSTAVSGKASGSSIGIPQNAKTMGLPVTPAEPAVTVVEISDPTAAGAGIELIDQDVMQLQSMPLRARRVIVRLESAAVVFHSTNLRVRTRTSVRKGLLGYVTFGPQAKGTVNGLPVRPDLMLIAEPGVGGAVRGRRGLREHCVPASAAGHQRSSHCPPTPERVSSAARRGDRCR